MNGGDDPGTRCDEEGCRCNQVFGAVHCLEHIDSWEIQDVTRALREGEQLDARGMRIDAVVLQELLRGLEDDDGLPLLPAANFRAATFTGNAHFRSATFGAGVFFGGATFAGHAGFGGVGFLGDAEFASAIFEDDASFNGVGFRGGANFVGATFDGDAVFAQSRVVGDANFIGASFAGDVNVSETWFEADAHFRAASFRRARRLGPFKVDGELKLDDCVFAERVSIEVDAAMVSGQATTFAAGALLRVRRAEIAFDNADFARASTLSGATTMRLGVAPDDQPRPLPRLMTLRGAHVAGLSLSDLDLAGCRFFGAHGLESLSIGANCTWLHGPPGRGSREMLAEEQLWRANDDSSDLRPLQIAALYRALRKAREDGKDEAGASDLYFGEMEMRRHGAAKRSDRAVLTLYHLISGYGLRASRALATMLVAVLAASLGLWAWGFEDAPSYTRALFVAVESTSSLLRTPDSHGLVATYAGEVIQIVLRLLGPLLIGLALLAVRARVKR